MSLAILVTACLTLQVESKGAQSLGADWAAVCHDGPEHAASIGWLSRNSGRWQTTTRFPREIADDGADEDGETGASGKTKRSVRSRLVPSGMNVATWACIRSGTPPMVLTGYDR